MTMQEESRRQPVQPRCCPCAGAGGVSRRDFLKAGTIALGGLALGGCAWAAMREAAGAPAPAPARQPLVVKPLFSYEMPRRHDKTSWRSWGGIETQAQANEEMVRLNGEFGKLAAAADFPVKFLPVSPVRGGGDVGKVDDLAGADVILLCPAGAGSDIFDAAVKTGKNVVFFLRHKSGPVYLWYEIISPRYLHGHSDRLVTKGVDNGDVVVDSMDELAWRLRALGGLKNALGMRIITIGGASGWACAEAPDLSRTKYKLDIQDVTYPQLAELIKAARDDKAAVARAKERAAAYLNDGGLKLETQPTYVENAFLLEQVFRGIMAKADAKAITVNACMGTIMPIAETTACLTLSLLNDAGFLAFCESDFVVIPSGILLTQISGRPQFLNDPTYPHQGVITLAHCTAPRKMDGKALEPARIMTHFESDYGAAPKVEMKKGTKVTNIIPDFKAERYTGFVGEIADVPFLPICRAQIDVAYKCPDARIAENMPGFHWMTIYGDYIREAAYALKRIPIAFENLG
jgi:hypothetical protein